MRVSERERKIGGCVLQCVLVNEKEKTRDRDAKKHKDKVRGDWKIEATDRERHRNRMNIDKWIIEIDKDNGNGKMVWKNIEKVTKCKNMHTNSKTYRKWNVHRNTDTYGQKDTQTKYET